MAGKRDVKKDAIRLMEMALFAIQAACESVGDTIDTTEALAICKTSAVNARQALAHLKREVL